MKHISPFLCMFSVASLVILSGCCHKYIDWFEHIFKKADPACMSLCEIHAHAVRMEHIRHDGLMTDDTVRVLWRSDRVVEFHERMSECCEGERLDMVERRIEKLKEENKNKAIFFVSLYGTKYDWAFTLSKDGQLYKPAEKVEDAPTTYQKTEITREESDGTVYEEKIEIKTTNDRYTYKTAEVKTIDLDRIYQHIFGKAAFRYRQNIYQVTFDVALEPPFEFILCNGQYTARLAWY